MKVSIGFKEFSKLDESMLQELDRAVEQQIPLHKFAHLPLNVAQIHLLRALEDAIRLGCAPYDEDPTFSTTFAKQLQHGFHYSMNWLHNHCKTNDLHHNLSRTDGAYYQSMGEVLIFSSYYSKAWDILSLMFRNELCLMDFTNSVAIAKRTSIPIGHTDITDNIISSPDPPSYLPSADLLQILHSASFFSESRLKTRGARKIEYSFPFKHFELVRNEVTKIIFHLWSLKSDWDLGGYTVSEFRNFWECLTSFVLIHQHLCYQSGMVNVNGAGIDDIVSVKPLRRWVKLLSKLSSIRPDVCELIITDLIYANSIQPNKIDIACTPFFQIQGNLIALSNQLVQHSYAERNIWDLLGERRPDAIDKLKSLKEELWRRDLKSQFNQVNIEVLGPLNYKGQAAEGDLDLLLVDQKDKFAIVCELKWLMGPDNIRGAFSAVGQLTKGLNQAHKSCLWAREQTAVKTNNDGLLSLQEYTVVPLLVSRDFMGGGRLDETRVPILNDRLLRWMILDPHSFSLRQVWYAAKQKTFLPLENVHYTKHDLEFKVGSISIKLPEYGYRMEQEWNPSSDIKTPQLNLNR